MDIAGGLAATSNALTLIKAIKDADTLLDTATLKAKLAEVMSQLADAKISQVEMMEENKRLSAENLRLLSADMDMASLTEIGGYLYKQDESNSATGWPACPTCVSRDKFIAFLVQDGDVEHAKCPRCHVKLFPVTSFVSPGYTRQAQKSDRRSYNMQELNRRLAEDNYRTRW